MMTVLILGMLLLVADEPAPPAEPSSSAQQTEPSSSAQQTEGATGTDAKNAPRKKRLRKGDGSSSSDGQTEKGTSPESPSDEAPLPESDRPIPKPGEELPTEPTTDEKLEDELGQELEEAQLPGQDPISRVAEGMRLAEEKLAQKIRDQETIGLQERIIKDLDELLAQAENPPPSGGGGKGSKKKQQMQPQNKQGQRPSTASRSNRPQRGNNSSERIGPPRSVREQLTPQDRQQNIWGHLSETMREEMGQYAKENFLAKYRDLIERYYTDIAKQSSRK
jgi:hypothetical protein